MNHLRRTAALSLVFVLGAGPAVAQIQHPDHDLPGARVEVRSADGPVTIPFRPQNDHVIIRVTIQGAHLDMVLDTGMPMDGVMLCRTAKIAGLKLSYEEGMGSRRHEVG